jgi:hypothetical protein
VVAHVQGSGTPHEVVGSLRDIGRRLGDEQYEEVRERLLGTLAPAGVLVDSMRATATCAFAALRLDATPGVKAVSGWDAVDMWAWAFAAARVPRAADLQALNVPARPGEPIQLRPGRRGRATRSGVAFVVELTGAVHPWVKTQAALASTLYTDAVLLGTAQSILLRQLTSDAHGCGDPASSGPDLQRLRNDLRIFRNRVWVRELSDSAIPNDTIRAVQHVHGLPERVDQLVEEVRDFSQEVALIRAERTNLFLGVLALLGVPAVVASVISVFPHARSTAVAVLVVTAALVAVPLMQVAMRLAVSYQRTTHKGHIETGA